ncbi:MAG: hypothetical protein JST92_07865, partial [Deltaproteobacteria bacterium]|nr:hypothetical protein [Deltaproteobacteria bacterium]
VAMMYTPTTNYTICRVRTPTPTNRDGRASTADVQAFMRTPLQQYVTGSQSIYWAPDHSSLAAMGQSYTSNGGYDYTAVDVFGLRAGDDAPSLWIAGAEYDQLRAYQLKAGFHTSADGRYIAIRANFSDGDTRAQASDSGPYSGVTHPRYLGDLMLIDLARGTVTTLATNVGEPGVWLGDGRLLYQRWYSPEPLSFQDGLYLLTPPRSAP